MKQKDKAYTTEHSAHYSPGSLVELTAAKEDASARLDIFIADNSGVTRSQVSRLIEEGQVLVNGKVEGRSYKVKAGDTVAVTVRGEPEDVLIAEDLPLEILYKDEHLVVVNKPPGMVVYPALGHMSGTLMNALLFRCGKLAGIGGPLRPGVVHRLDKDTSGVMVVALKDEAYYDLVEQFRDRRIDRKYLALVYGSLKDDKGEISMKIGRSVSDRKKMSTKTKRGKEAVTAWKALLRFGPATLIEAKLGTGRTHQIRVHFAAIGHPVLGDETYGKKTAVEVGRRKVTFGRQMLHAETLGFIHPATGERMEYRCPLPEDMSDCLKKLETPEDSE